MNGEQLRLPMLTQYSGPQLVNPEVVRAAATYRLAVLGCWNLRIRRKMTRRLLAEETGMLPSHLTDYLADDADRRDMPAKYIQAMEVACGNRFISQWLAMQANLTILEQYLHRRAA
jgi:hypothetical protein